MGDYAMGIAVHVMRTMVALVFMLAMPAAAQNQNASVSPSESPTSSAPAWAYPINPPDFRPGPDDGTLRRVPDSSAEFTLTQLRDRFFAPDWHPGDHPPMPDVVARGRKPDVFACGFCHRADGPGGPENSSLAGLPAAYIVQQMANYKSGARKTSVPGRVPVQLMLSLSRAASDAEVEAAAAYFSALKPRATIKVVETATVPKTYVAGWFLVAAKTEDREPIDQRIIEIPEDADLFNSRDSHAQFIAYVPIGSLAKGEILVKSGEGGKTIPCGICHGADLRGTRTIPGIAGRSPSYIVRQLYDFKHGAWTGMGANQMKPAVAKLAVEDMVSMAAYLAYLAP
jgi:cytochrome c553